LLESAGALIAASGFADVDSKTIAAHAAADVASIHYHFGSRAGLYIAVLTEAHRQLISSEGLQAIADMDSPAHEKL